MEQEKQNGNGTPAPEWSQYNSPAVEELLAIRDDIARLRTGPDTIADAAKLSRRLSEAAARLGAYYLAVPEELLAAGESFYNSHVEALRTALTDGGADIETIAAVTRDYAAALFGMELQATTRQMKTALNACNPIVAYKLDKYGAFLGLLCVYSRNLYTLTEYTKRVKEQPDAKERALYFAAEPSAGEFSDLRAAALYWLQNIGYITADDFAGVDQGIISRFLTYVEMYGTNGRFAQYVFIAKNTLNATPEQLRELPAPALFGLAKVSPIQAALNYADIVGEEIALYLERVAEQIEAAAPQVQAKQPNTPDEQPGADGSAGMQLKPLYVPEDIALMAGRDVWAAPEERGKISPITVFIADFIRRNPQYADIGTYPINKAIDGVNILRQSNAARFDGDKYTIETNISEFANICEGYDANETQKQELLTALMVLNNLYVVVWRKSGRVAVKLLTVRELGMDKQERGKRQIEVYANALKGRPNLVSLGEYKDMKKSVTGESKAHFVFQVIGGNNKKENTMISEVFGYDTKKQNAQDTGDAEQIRAVEEYERKNRPRDRKYLLKWFEEWSQNGLIKYTRTQNKAGEWVFRWKRLKPLTPEEQAVISEMRKKYNLPD